MKTAFALTLALSLAGCAAPANEPQQLAVEERVVCIVDAPTGSKIPTRQCRTVKDIDRVSRADRDTAESIPVTLHEVLLGR
jgi:hypothetical protein